jgi:hypothetical protein
MNRLLQSLEGLGYVVRSDPPDEGRARIVRFTKRGRAAYSKTLGILRGIEREWSVELGPRDFAQLKELLFRVWESPWISQGCCSRPDQNGGDGRWILSGHQPSYQLRTDRRTVEVFYRLT